MYRPDAISLNGSTHYALRGAGLTGASDNKTLLFSCWFQRDGGANILACTGIAVRIYFSGADKLIVFAENVGGDGILTLTSDTAFAASATWHHVVATANLATAAGRLYIDGVDDEAAGATLTDDTIDWTVADWSIGAAVGGGSKYEGKLADVYLTNEYLDIDTASNLAKLITVAGKPEDPGSDGSTPTGTAALVYMKFAEGALNTNAGSGGDFDAFAGSPVNSIGPITPRQARARY